MGTSAKLRLLVLLAFRSLYSHKAKSLIVGALIFFGTILVVVGTSLLASVERAMSASIISSVAGHLQVYDAEAKDPLALFGSGFMGVDDVGEMSDFATVKRTLESLDNVKAVIPMGIGLALTNDDNAVDSVLASLRKAVNEGDQGATSAHAGRLRMMAAELAKEVSNQTLITADQDGNAKALAALARIQTDAFWASMADNTEANLQFLDTEIAPLVADGRIYYVSYLGTDMVRFPQNFDRFKLTSGQVVPAGQRGMLLSSRFYEKRLKHKVARDLDTLVYKRSQQAEIAEDGVLTSIANGLPGQYQQVTLKLSPSDARAAEAELQKVFPDVTGGLSELVKTLLTVDDSNAEVRTDLFYRVFAERMNLYPVAVGDSITLRAFTKSGYIKNVNVKVWGIYQFEGLETSDIAGARNLVDMVTFRELRGQMSASTRAELNDIRDDLGLVTVTADNAEESLFGAESEVEDTTADVGFDEFAEVDLSGQVARMKVQSQSGFDQANIDDGLALNAAVILHDPDQLEETMVAIRAASERVDLAIQVTDWQTASGMVGQFITVIRIVLWVAIIIIFLVTLVIINNSMLLATMERVGEIGTIRAIGASRRFVLAMFLLETTLLGIGSGLLGGATGAGLIQYLGGAGIPAAGKDILIFLFSGPRLYPSVGAAQLALGFAAVLFVSVASTIYPAMIATRVQPIVAMQAKE
jgi:ABC-type lipoprotein release transport system permease subunit